MWGELAQALQHGNGYLIAMLVIGFAAVTVLLERLIMFQVVYHIDFRKFLGHLKKMIQAEDLPRAMTLCKNTSSVSLPHIAMKALEAAETDPSKIRATIEEETIEFLPHLERRLGILPALTLLIFLLGILGTIDSLYTAFQSTDVLDSAKKQATLAQGIAGSLSSTAFALMFGMILLSGFYLLKGMAANLTDRLHYGVTVLLHLLAPNEAVAYVPMASSQDSSPPPSLSDVGPTQSASAKSTPEAPPEESFDDVSVEDIKDEEEII